MPSSESSHGVLPLHLSYLNFNVLLNLCATMPRRNWA